MLTRGCLGFEKSWTVGTVFVRYSGLRCGGCGRGDGRDSCGPEACPPCAREKQDDVNGKKRPGDLKTCLAEVNQTAAARV